MSARKKVTVYLKGGASFEVTADDFAVYKNGLGAYARITWDKPLPNILLLQIDEVAAVLEHV